MGLFGQPGIFFADYVDYNGHNDRLAGQPIDKAHPVLCPFGASLV